MTQTASRITRWIVRLIVFAAIYAGVASIWISNAKGWDSLSVLGASFAFAAILVPVFGSALAIEHFYIANAWARIVAHPLIMVGLFIVGSLIVICGYFGDPAESVFPEVLRFATLVAGCALADAAIDMLLERKLSSAPQAGS